jgi:hypothetical protein
MDSPNSSSSPPFKKTPRCRLSLTTSGCRFPKRKHPWIQATAAEQSHKAARHNVGSQESRYHRLYLFLVTPLYIFFFYISAGTVFREISVLRKIQDRTGQALIWMRWSLTTISSPRPPPPTVLLFLFLSFLSSISYPTCVWVWRFVGHADLLTSLNIAEK